MCELAHHPSPIFSANTFPSWSKFILAAKPHFHKDELTGESCEQTMGKSNEHRQLMIKGFTLLVSIRAVLKVSGVCGVAARLHGGGGGEVAWDWVLVVVPRKAEVARAHRRRAEHPLTQGCHKYHYFYVFKISSVKKNSDKTSIEKETWLYFL